MRTAPITILFALTLSFPAAAQPWRQPCSFGSDQTCITINFQLSVPMPNTAPGDWTDVVAKANKSLFDIVNHECTVLQSAFPGGCRLEQLNASSNVGANRGGMPGGQQTVSATASATYLMGDQPPPATSPH